MLFYVEARSNQRVFRASLLAFLKRHGGDLLVDIRVGVDPVEELSDEGHGGATNKQKQLSGVTAGKLF